MRSSVFHFLRHFRKPLRVSWLANLPTSNVYGLPLRTNPHCYLTVWLSFQTSLALSQKMCPWERRMEVSDAGRGTRNCGCWFSFSGESRTHGRHEERATQRSLRSCTLENLALENSHSLTITELASFWDSSLSVLWCSYFTNKRAKSRTRLFLGSYQAGLNTHVF